MMAVRSLVARVQRLEQARTAPRSPFEAAYGSFGALAGEVQAGIASGTYDERDMPLVLNCLRRWNSDAFRNATWSVSVHHGAAAKILSDAVHRTDQVLPRTDPGYQASLINNIYDRRTEYVTDLRNRAIAKHRINDARGLTSVINIRYPRERRDALRMLDLEHPQ